VRQQRLRQVVLDPSWWDKQAQQVGYHGVLSLQEQECEFRNDISTAAAIFHHKKEKSHLPSYFIPQQPGETDQTVACCRGQDNSFHGPQQHVIKGPLGKALAGKEGLDLREEIIQHTGTSPGATFIQGSKPIDGLWISSNLDISNACVMPFGYSIGNHRAFILDIQIESLVGVDSVKIVQPAGRQLNS
jgi:hypothetical protein